MIRQICLILFLSIKIVQSSGLNAVIEIRDPDNGYHEPGDTLSVRLVLTDDDNNNLSIDEYRQHGIRTIEMWVSGPRQDYRMVQPYVDLIILDRNGINDSTGINPETGEIPVILPDWDVLDVPGTFTVLFEIIRRADGETTSALPFIDFQVDQSEVTETPSMKYITCGGEDCHNPLHTDATHTSSDLNTCIICHTRDYELPWNGFMHGFRCHDCEEFEPTNTCHLCHLANAGIANFSHTGCFSACHSYDDTPEDHTEYREDVCILCHADTQSVYATHQEFQPPPPQQFDLIFPEDEVVIDSMPLVFSWQASFDNDQDDILRYQIELSADEYFDEFQVIRAGDSTSFAFYYYNLSYNTDYWWRVHAVDLNSEGTYSNEIRLFHTSVWGVDQQENKHPSVFEIKSAYPNPFNSSTTIHYQISKPGEIEIEIIDIRGNMVSTLLRKKATPGSYQITWNAGYIPSGIYFCRLRSSDTTKHIKLAILR